MSIIRRILVPLDGSDLAEEALGVAERIASAAAADLDLVMVHEDFPFAIDEDATWRDNAYQLEWAYLGRLSEDVGKRCPVPIHHVLMKGDIVPSVRARIQLTRTDLVVMTHTAGRASAARGSEASPMRSCGERPCRYSWFVRRRGLHPPRPPTHRSAGF